MEQLTGIVQRVTFHSEETGWSVLRVSPLDRPSEQITVTVHQAKIFAGATICFEGEWTHHPKYGEQFKATQTTEKKPASSSALEKYIGSGLIYGVGPKTAKKIVQHFGADTLRIFEEEIHRLTEVSGIARAKLVQIKEAWEEHRNIRDVMMFLQEHGISTLFAVKIFQQYGVKSIEIVSSNPYQLSRDIYGIGFFSADKVALSMGFAKDSPERIAAAIKHVLSSSREEGHCYLTLPQVIKGVQELLKEDYEDLVIQLLRTLEEANELRTRVVKEAAENITCYYSKSLFYDEAYTADKTKVLCKQTVNADDSRIRNWLDRYNHQQPFPLSDEQYEAVAQIVQHNMSILTGGPGCGKTTTTKTLVKLILAMGKKVLLAAPTGRAAQRMGEVIGMEAKTIHRLLEWNPAQGAFTKGEEDPLVADFVIIDECSMLDISLTASLLKAIPERTQLLMIGDVDQLPSVGAGNVLKDLIDSKAVPCFALTKVFRQAQESLIISNAHMINQGRTPKVESPIHTPTAWNDGTDCLFVDSEEATAEQSKFIHKISKTLKDTADTGNITVLEEEPGTYKTVDADRNYYMEDISEEELQQLRYQGHKAYTFTIPQRFMNANVQQLLHSKDDASALKTILGNIHPWSTLHYGFTASEMVLRLYQHTIAQKVNPDWEIQILSPMTRGSMGTRNLNTLIQEAYNPLGEGKRELKIGDRIYREGDRVIQKRNNYDLEVFNGDIGKILHADTQDFELTVIFGKGLDERLVTYKKDNLIELDLAYAITIHKSQGSEFDAVIIPVVTQHFTMLYRNLIYTGLTRAKKMAVFVGTRKALGIAVRNVDNRKRQTMLRELLGIRD
ncbi:SF1B family DNA helicase RecD2 [Algivirga pacifica]|uniref:AAA+ ATPase domain-containing protein n=1 Tax=Algivirga pacifica TaxID=1162670 RepID=A0ABP9DKM4_9BACT